VQSKDTASSPSLPNKRAPWYKSIALVSTLLFVSIINFIATCAYVTGQMEIKPTLLILERDGCALLVQNGVPVLDQANSDSCRAIATFRANMVGTGGRVFLEDRQIMIADNHVIATSPLEDQPTTPEQGRLVDLVVICAAIVLCMVIWANTL
jgi:hypothetical protein